MAGRARKPQAEVRSLSATDLPRTDELLVGIRDFLRACFTVQRVARLFHVDATQLQKRLDNAPRQLTLFADENEVARQSRLTKVAELRQMIALREGRTDER